MRTIFNKTLGDLFSECTINQNYGTLYDGNKGVNWHLKYNKQNLSLLGKAKVWWYLKRCEWHIKHQLKETS